MDDFWCARANRILFDVIFKAVNLLFWCIFSKTGISPRRNYNFWGFWEFSKYSTWHVLIPALVTATLRVLPRIFADLDCLRYNASTTWTHIVSLTGASSNAHGLCVSKPCGKFQRTYSNVAWRMSGKFKRTYSKVAWRMQGKFQRTYIAWHDAWVESSRELTVATEKHVLRKFTWTLLHAPPHPTRPHPTPPVHTCTYRQPQTSMSFLRKFTWTLLHAPPHPTPPMCTKHHGRGPTIYNL